MKNRIVSEKDLGEAINLLMEGNLPVSTATVINLVQRLQQTPVAPEPAQECLHKTPVAPKPEQERLQQTPRRGQPEPVQEAPVPKMEVVRDE